MTKCQQGSNDGAWSSIAGSSRHRPFAPASGDIFATRKEVKVAGTIDGQPFQATLLPTGDGTHMVPPKAALRKTLGKEIGDSVAVHLQQRLS